MEKTLADHVASVSKVDQELWMGHIVWYQVGPVNVTHAEVVQNLHTHNLSVGLPPYPKDFDVFRRVCSEQQIRRMPNGPDNFQSYLLREVRNDEQIITKRIVVEHLNKKGKVLSYEQLIDLDFHRKNSEIVVSDHSPAASLNYPTAVHIATSVKSEFLKWRGKLNSYAIREFVRKLLLSWSATCVRDGMYFLPESKAGDLDGLDGFANSIAGVDFHSMPLVDNARQREMVRKAFQSETVEQIHAQMGEIAELRKAGKKISQDRYAKIITDYQAIMAHTQEYEEVLEVEMQEVQDVLKLFGPQVLGLADLVKQ